MPYTKLSEINPSLKGIKPALDLEQANHIASMADAITDVDSPWAVAISNFKKAYVVEGDKWVKKQVKEGEEVQSGVKAVTEDGKNYVILETMNAFMDREKEIFSTQSIENYVDFVAKIGRKDRVRFWHVPGTDFATVVWQGMPGRFLLEVAEVDDTAFGRKMFEVLSSPQDYPETLPDGWGTSHGYLYRAKDRTDDGVYSHFLKFESTVLPAHRASNPYGRIGTKEVDMAGLDEGKMKALVDLVGKEVAEAALASTGTKSDDLEVVADFKEDATVVTAIDTTAEGDDQAWEIEVDDDFLAEVAKRVPSAGTEEDVIAGVKTLLDDFQKTTLAEVAKLIADSVGTKEQLVKDAIAGRIALRPYTASKDNGNVMEGDALLEAQKAKDKRLPRDMDPVDYAVQNMVLNSLK